MFNNEKLTFGECKVKSVEPVEDNQAEGDYFCFVNEDTVCPKVEFKSRPGTFLSTKPCKDPVALKRRLTGLVAAISFGIGAILVM